MERKSANGVKAKRTNIIMAHLKIKHIEKNSFWGRKINDGRRLNGYY